MFLSLKNKKIISSSDLSFNFLDKVRNINQDHKCRKVFAICASINKTVFTVQHIFQNHSLFRYGSLIQNVRLKLHYLCKSIGTEGDRLISGGPTNMLRKSLFAKALMQDSADIGRMQKFWASCELAWVT